MTINPELLQEHYVTVNGIKLHVVTSGPNDGPVLLFLHGFPEFWFGWKNQIQYFASLGYRVLVPDQRGYNLSEKPDEVEKYSLDYLAGDVIGLLDWAQASRAFLVGHDWGAAVAWWAALKYPERFEKQVILNVPHPSVMKKNLTSNPLQLLRSWYMLFFQIPKIPEMLLLRNSAKDLLLEFKKTKTFSHEDLEKYQKAWFQPHAMKSMLQWYRAGLRAKNQKLPETTVSVPTLILWGTKDKYLGKEMAQESLAYCKNGKLQLIEDATHWVQHEKASFVNQSIQDFIS